MCVPLLHAFYKIGQVSLPVLSRKGKFDYWHSTWVSKKNYSSLFTEDLFLKQFLFMFFMYSVSKNKHFISIFMKKKTFFENNLVKNNYTLQSGVKVSYNPATKHLQKHYLSNVYICRYANWVFLYLFIYTPQIRNRSFTQSRSKLQLNRSLFNQLNSYTKSYFYKSK